MTQIMMFVMFGLLALVVLVYWVQRSRSGDVRGETECLEAEDILACLHFEALTKPFVESIFSEQDWIFISGRASGEIQQLFQTHRRRLAISWLRRTRKQVAQFMAFRRAAVRQKVEISPTVEIRVIFEYVLFLLTYYVLWVSVWLRGPIQARKMAGYTLDATSQLCVSLGHLMSTVAASHITRTEARSTNRLIAG